MRSHISNVLIQAYRNTDYHVTTNNLFILRIGTYSELLEHLHVRHDCKSSAFVTAYCPFSKSLSLEENEKLQHLLETELTAMGFRFINGYGQGRGANSDWKERSVLVLGVSLEEATRLAKKYEQNAFVWNDSDCISRLIVINR